MEDRKVWSPTGHTTIKAGNGPLRRLLAHEKPHLGMETYLGGAILCV